MPFSVCEFRESNREMRVLGGRGFTVERERGFQVNNLL